MSSPAACQFHVALRLISPKQQGVAANALAAQCDRCGQADLAQMYRWMYISAMSRRYSIAEARANLPTILDQVESGAGVELTRRGKPVAVMMSITEYERLRGERADFKETYRRFLRSHRLADAGIERGFFSGLRDHTSGRKVAL